MTWGASGQRSPHVQRFDVLSGGPLLLFLLKMFANLVTSHRHGTVQSFGSR